MIPHSICTNASLWTIMKPRIPWVASFWLSLFKVPHPSSIFYFTFSSILFSTVLSFQLIIFLLLSSPFFDFLVMNSQGASHGVSCQFGSPYLEGSLHWRESICHRVSLHAEKSPITRVFLLSHSFPSGGGSHRASSSNVGRHLVGHPPLVGRQRFDIGQNSPSTRGSQMFSYESLSRCIDYAPFYLRWLQKFPLFLAWWTVMVMPCTWPSCCILRFHQMRLPSY